MLGFAGSSYALFALVWSAICVLSGALVTDAMLRGAAPPAMADLDTSGEAVQPEL